MTSERIGMLVDGSSSAPHDHEEGAGHHEQPDRDAEGVVLDAARLDPPQPAARVPDEAPDAVHGAVDDRPVEPPQERRRSGRRCRMNSRSLRSSNHHLLREARYRNRVAAVAPASAPRRRRGCPGGGTNPNSQMPTTRPTAATRTLDEDERAIDAEQLVRLGVAAEHRSDSANTGSSHDVQRARVPPNGRAAQISAMPSSAAGIASRTSGQRHRATATRGCCGSTCGSTRLSP